MEDNRLSQRDSEEHESEKEHVDHEQDLPDQNSAHEQGMSIYPGLIDKVTVNLR